MHRHCSCWNKAADTVGKKSSRCCSQERPVQVPGQQRQQDAFKIVVDDKENYFSKEIVEVEQGDARNKVIVIKILPLLRSWM